jgi:glycosyltransferase involved in cell wall biosynthesis
MSRPASVSVIITLYNLGVYVGEAIESALAQTLPAEDLEVVVVDDGSTDGGGDVARRYAPRVRVHRQENRGVSAARNAGTRVSTGTFLTFLDADDRLGPEKLATQLGMFSARPEVVAVWSGVRYVDASGAALPARGWARLEGPVFARLVLGNVGPPHAALVRRDAVEAAGGFDERLCGAADWDLWLRIARGGRPWTTVDRPLADYRVRPDAMHQHSDAMAEDCRRVLDKLFADPGLPSEILALKPLAYQNVYLTAACDHYRAGDRAAGRRWFRAAVRMRPDLLTEPRGLRRVCRLLLPVGWQSDAAVVASWRRLAPVLRAMLADLFASGDLEADLARRRLGARVAYWRTVARFARRSALAGGTDRR